MSQRVRDEARVWLIVLAVTFPGILAAVLLTLRYHHR